jgi:hypothetical protein
VSSSHSQGTNATAKPTGFAAVGARLAWLTLAVLIMYPVFGGVAAALVGPSAWQSAALAAFICWLGAASALAVAGLFREPREAMYGLLIGIGLRMGLPLAAVMALARLAPGLRESGFFVLILAFYLVTLATETLLTLKVVPHKPSAAEVS